MKLKKIIILIIIAILSISFIYRIDNLHRIPDSDDLDNVITAIRTVDFGSISKISTSLGLSTIMVNADTQSSNGGDFYGEIVYPAEKSEISGNVKIKAVAISYPHPVDSVEFYINNNKIAVVENISQEYFSTEYNTALQEDGITSIKIVIHNSIGESLVRSNNVVIKQ